MASWLLIRRAANLFIWCVIDMLTEKENQVALLVSQGLTNREIAERLHLANGTVRNNVSVCLQKLYLSNRSQLTAWALKNGLEQNIVREPSNPDTYKDMLFGIYS